MSVISSLADTLFSSIEKLSNWRHKYSFFKYQKNSFHQPKSVIEKAKRIGFTVDEYVIYDLEHNDYREYLSEFERKSFREKSKSYKILMDNKIIFSILVDKYGKANKLFAYKMRGIFVTYESGFEFIHLMERLKELGKIVFKLESGPGGGAGFRLFEYSSNQFYINRIESSEREIIDILSNEDDYLLEEYCSQCEFENQIFPSAVNTIRLITGQQKSGSYEVLAALHRFGSKEGSCIDNATAGGLFSQIDIETGIMSAATSYANYNSIKTLFKNHPITGTPIEGVKVPGWETIIKDICDLHYNLSFTGVPFVAWDVALTNTGIKVIEGNTSCGFKFLQRWHGERNGRVGKWMIENGFIEK